MLSPNLDTVRLLVHVLAAAVWVGGQFALVGLLPVLRGLGDDAPRAAARGFARVAWPAFAVVVATGIWNVLEVDLASADIAYHLTLGLKVLLVAAIGLAAFAHGATRDRRLLALTGALGAVGGVVVLFLGVLLAHPG